MSELQQPRQGVSFGQVALLVTLAVALYLAFRILRPFLDPIVVAMILAPILHPLFRWMRTRLRGRAGLAAFLVCALVLLVIAGPLSLLAIGIVSQGADSVEAIQTWVTEGNVQRLLADPRLDAAKEFVSRIMPLVEPDRLDLESLLMAVSAKLGNAVASKATTVVTGTGLVVSQIFLMLFVLFFFVRDGEELLAAVRGLSPLHSSQEEALLRSFKAASKSSLVGIFGTAIAQGAAGGLGLAFVGLPGLFWGAVMAITSLIPFVGTALVWIPAATFLLVTGHTGKAVFLALWCLVVVGSIDNFLRPLLMKGSSEMSTLWMFFAVVGGLQYFGFLGLLYGPIVFALCAALLALYRAAFSTHLEKVVTE
ncbi:MAG: AI-2E family transporter [Acidobacteriota bacterium]